MQRIDPRHQPGSARGGLRRHLVGEQQGGAGRRLDRIVRQHGHQDFVVAADLDEGDATRDQPRDHVGEHLVAPGDEHRAVDAEIALQRGIRFAADGFADRTFRPDVDVEFRRRGRRRQTRADQVGIDLLDRIGEAVSALALDGADRIVAVRPGEVEQAGALPGIGKLVPGDLVEEGGILGRRRGEIAVGGDRQPGRRLGQPADRVLVGPLEHVLDRVAGADDDEHQVVLAVEGIGAAGADHGGVVLPEASDIGPVREAALAPLGDEAGIFAGRVDDRPLGIGQIGGLFRPLVVGDLGAQALADGGRRGRSGPGGRDTGRGRRGEAVGQSEDRDQQDQDDQIEDRLRQTPDQPQEGHRTVRPSPGVRRRGSPGRSR